MADSVFNIRLTAVDDATKVVNKVNKAVSQIFRPYDNAKKSTKSFFDALGKNDMIARPLSGFQKLGGAIGSIGSSFGVAESSVLASSTRMAASIASIGGPFAGVIAGGVAAAGAAGAVAVNMGKQGQSIQRVAAGLGMSTQELQIFRSQADQTGISVDTMDSSLEAFAANLTNVAAGTAPELANVFAAMHVDLKKDANGVIDVAAAWRDFQSVLSKMDNPQQQRVAADMAGVGSTLPLLRKTSEELEKLRENALKTGQVMSDELVNKNDKQADSWNRMKSAIDGVGTSVGNLIADMVHLGAVADWTTTAAEAVAKRAAAKAEERKKTRASGLWDGINLGTGLLNPATGLVGVGRFLAGALDSGTKPVGSRSASGNVTDLTGNPAIDSANKVARGIRTNNPGNLRSWPGAESQGGYAAFPTAGAGLNAMAKNLLAYQDKHGINTITGVVNRWAPSSDNNNVPAYVSAMSKQTGYGADQALDFHDPKVLAPLISSITKHENGQNPYSAEAIGKAVEDALGKGGGGASGNAPEINLTVNNVPAGLTVKLASSSPGNVGLAFAPGSAN